MIDRAAELADLAELVPDHLVPVPADALFAVPSHGYQNWTHELVHHVGLDLTDAQLGRLEASVVALVDYLRVQNLTAIAMRIGEPCRALAAALDSVTSAPQQTASLTVGAFADRLAGPCRALQETLRSVNAGLGYRVVLGEVGRAAIERSAALALRLHKSVPVGRAGELARAH